MKQILRASAACAALAASPALAADYDPPIYVEEAPEYVPVEIGSGWYLRGDVAYSAKRSFRDTAIRLDNSLFDAALVNFDPVAPLSIFSIAAKSTPLSGGIGIGYHVNDILRLEANIGLLANDKYSGTGFLDAGSIQFGGNNYDVGCLGTRTTTTTIYDTNGDPVGVPVVAVDNNARDGCGVSASIDNSAWTGTLNAYADLGTIAGFTPYVGVGGGLIYTRTKLALDAQCAAAHTDTTTPLLAGGQAQISETFLCRGQSGPGDDPASYNTADLRHTQYDFLYNLSAGVAYQLSENTKIDLGYQYTDVPKYKGADLHQIKLGLRYNLW